MPNRDTPQAKPENNTRGAKSPATGTAPATSGRASLNDSMATVHYEISLTKKTGDFEFLKLTAGAEIPVDASPELLKKIAKDMVVVKDLVIARLEEDMKSINL